MQRKVNRRKFFRSLVGETITFMETVSGKPHLSLSELADLPDDKILPLIPMIGDWLEILLDDQVVRAKSGDSPESLVLFTRNSIEAEIFNRFDGQHAIGHIAQDLASTMDINIDESFQLVRNFFLKLVQLGCCVPSNLIE